MLETIGAALVLILLVLISFSFANRQKGIRRWHGLHVLVTGGSSGLGLEIASELGRRGVGRVALVARDVTKLNQATEQVRKEMSCDSGSVKGYPCDLCGLGNAEAMVAEVEEDGGPIDVLVHCVGGSEPGYMMDLSDQVFESQMKLNYLSLVYVARAVGRRMVDRKQGGYILSVNSMGGLVGTFGYSAYTPSKMAARGFMECLYYEWNRFDVRVSSLFAPDMDTPGYALEHKTKPKETYATSATIVFQPREVAISAIRGMERGTFRISHGLDGALLTWLTSGGSPHALPIEVLLMGPLRLVMQWYILHWNRIFRQSKPT